MESKTITDIVVDINDFLIVANMKHGAIHMTKNGGITMMLNSAMREEKFLLKKFFKSIENLEASTQLADKYYYENVILPPILVDYLFDAESDEVLLTKIHDHLNDNASWMERNGLSAIAEMSFDSDISPYHRMYNKENMRLVEILKKNGYRIHLLGNCSRRSLDKIMEVHGKLNVDSITTSADIKALKCSSGSNTKIFEKYMTEKGFDPNKTLFIEFNQGYIDTINKYDNRIKTIRYWGKDQKIYFVEELANLLNIDIDFDFIKGNI